jgi:hypothetical protein
MFRFWVLGYWCFGYCLQNFMSYYTEPPAIPDSLLNAENWADLLVLPVGVPVALLYITNASTFTP